MRFKNTRPSESPHVDLVPMMDVLMSILTFFIISAMSVQGGRSILNVDLPQAVAGVFGDRPASTPRLAAKPLVVELFSADQIAVDGVIVDAAQLPLQVQSYLVQNPQGQVLLKANRNLTYAEVAGALKMIREIGGDRVSLAIESAR